MRTFSTLICLLLIGAAPQKETSVAPPPIVRTNVTPPPVIQQVRSWHTQDFVDHVVAYTTNDSGSVFGMICGTSCVYYVNFQKECDKGDQYPAMVNTPSGAYPVVLRCYHLDTKRILTFQADESSIGIMGDSGELGFAFPLQDGRFGVSRFSLSGGLAAITSILDVAIQRQDSRQEGLRDFTI